MDAIARTMAAAETRRSFFARGAQGIGAIALASLLGKDARAAGTGAGYVHRYAARTAAFRAESQALHLPPSGGARR